MSTSLQYDRFITFLSALQGSGRMEDAVELLKGTQYNDESEVVTLTHESLYDPYQDAIDIDEMVSMLTTKYTQVFDGSQPIQINSQMQRYPKFDEQVSPMLTDMINEIRDVTPGKYWDFTISFTKMGTLLNCMVSGTVSRPYPSGQVLPERTVRIGAAGFDIIMCLTYARYLVLQEITRPL